MAPTVTEREERQWIDPKPRDFTEATFKCRSTPTGTLPTDEDLYNAITRGFVTTNMPLVEATDSAAARRFGCFHQDLVSALGQGKAGHSPKHSAGNADND